MHRPQFFPRYSNKIHGERPVRYRSRPPVFFQEVHSAALRPPSFGPVQLLPADPFAPTPTDYAPSTVQVTVSSRWVKAFAAQPLAVKNTFLTMLMRPSVWRAAPLQSLEFPRAAALPQLLGIARAHRIVDAVQVQTDAVGLAVESAVASHGLEFGTVGLFHAPDAPRQQLGDRRARSGGTVPSR